MNNQKWLSLTFLLGATALAQQTPPAHVEINSGLIEKEATGLKKLQQRIVDAETQVNELIKSGRLESCPRVVVYDWATASNQAEHDAISEGALILLLAISKDPTELPVKLAYVNRGKEKPIRLIKIGELSSAMVKRLKLTGIVGTNAWAGLYWLPAIRRIEGKVLVDFSKNREDFSIGLSLPPDQKMFEGLNDHITEFPGLPNSAVKAMSEREFPGFELDKGFLDYLQRQAAPAQKQP
ncbi:MAG: hypothetical protein WAT51_00410 [Holophaga sp.]